MHKPVKFEHRLQRHPAIIKLYLFFQEFVSWKVVISKVVLAIEDMFRMEITLSNKVGKRTELPQSDVQLSFRLETCLLDFLP